MDGATPRGGDERRWAAAGWALLAVSAAWVFWRYLVVYPGELWQLDLEVYRDGARNLVLGVPLYDWLTGVPQFLPFTYPPFSALLMLPTAAVPLSVAGWAWSLLQVTLTWVGAGIAFAPFLRRFGHRAPLARGAVAAVLVQLFPVSDGVRFGQMNAVVVTLCLLDARARLDARSGDGGNRPGWLPRGALTGIAAAVKLTPSAFWVHFAVARRWRTLAASVGTAAAATLFAFAVDPSASAVFWTDAINDPARLGPNDGVSNQSVRGVFLRLAADQPTLQTALWLAGGALVSWVGFRAAARYEAAGQRVGVVAVVGMVIVLISPVSWIHHWHWTIAVLGVLLGDGRRRARMVATLVLTTVLLTPAPWWGGWWPGALVVPGLIVQQSYTLVAIVALTLLVRWAPAPSPIPPPSAG